MLEELAEALAKVAHLQHSSTIQQGEAVVLASGDPGYFGILRTLKRRFPPSQLQVNPAASSVAQAFALLAMPWEDAVVISAHGRPLDDVMAALQETLTNQLEHASRRPLVSGRPLDGPKVALLCEPHVPPELIAAKLLECWSQPQPLRCAVVSNLGTKDQSMFVGSLMETARQHHPHRSVLIIFGDLGVNDSSATKAVHWGGSGTREVPQHTRAPRKQPSALLSSKGAWGLPDDLFEHRDNMITKSAVRAVVLARLGLGTGGVLWDIGAGCGSVAIEAFLADPSLEVYAIEKDPEQAARAQRNAERLGARINVVVATFPDGLGILPTAQRIFVGGGGLDVLEAAIGFSDELGRVVATFASLQRAARAAELLGNLEQISIAQGSRLGDGTWRLQGLNPVFLCWGDKVAKENSRARDI
jgi:precorrin-6Y C5,15-methyltransferase (decarboxylating)